MSNLIKFAVLICLLSFIGCITVNPPGTKPAKTVKKNDDKKEEEKDDEMKPFKEVTKDTEVLKGLFTTYQKKKHLYWEILPDQLKDDYIFMAAIEKGTGADGLLAGCPLDDSLIYLKRVEDKILFYKRNAFVRAEPGSPERIAVDRAFTDSLLVSAKIESINPENKAVLIDLHPLFIADLSSLARRLKDYSLKKDDSYLQSFKNFPKNIELVFRYNFTGKKDKRKQEVPDARNMELGVHYSFSRLPASTKDYRPRLADDRVGYFQSYLKDFSSTDPKTPIVSYVRRWRLEKSDPEAELSPPKKPIVFYIDKATPPEHRQAAKEGVLMWNKAFEKIGFKDAIEARMQPDDADWEAADIRYNVILWVTSHSSSFAGLGPSRGNPLTGQLLDADILIESEIFKRLGRFYHYYVDGSSAPSETNYRSEEFSCAASRALEEEASFAALTMFARGELESAGEVPREFINEYIRELVCHEVGHTLGLRHNFKGTTLHSLKDLNNKQLVSQQGLSSSIMDYTPVNVHPKEVDTHYFSQSVGPYDCWAIEYGYKPIEADSVEGELPALKEIVGRAGRPELAFGSDGDADRLDPECTRHDLGRDPFEFCLQRTKLVEELLPKLTAKLLKEGESYSELRYAFGRLLAVYRSSALLASRHIGGVHFRREHFGDTERDPLQVVPAARQREALDFILDNIFSDKLYQQFTPELLNKLVPKRAADWGGRHDVRYPTHQIVLKIQSQVLDHLLSHSVMNSLLNSEDQFPEGDPVFTLADLFQELTWGIWSELKNESPKHKFSNKTPFISTYRRSLQRAYVSRLIKIVFSPSQANPEKDIPEDVRSLSWKLLKDLKQAIDLTLEKFDGTLNLASQAHLEETSARIEKALFGLDLFPKKQ